MPDFSFLEFPDDIDQSQDISHVLKDFLKHIVNKKLQLYKQYIHTEGDKQGQSLFSHVMDLVSFTDRLYPVIGLSDEEMRCTLLALTVHDINKIPLYGKAANGWNVKYVDAATPANIQKELERLEVDDFLPRWKEYLSDIMFLAHAHQAASTSTIILIDQRYIDQTILKSRLKGALKYLMQAADVSDNSHSGDHRDPHEVHLRDKLLIHINAIMSRAGHEYEYRFIGHRLAELRGIITNVIHNELVSYFREKYGEDECIDLQYYPEGVNYLLDKRITLEWNDHILREVAERVRQKLAGIQLKKLSQFIKPKPSPILVDEAAMNIGATLSEIFEVIILTIMGKQYKSEWREQRDALLRNDLKEILADEKTSVELKEYVINILQQAEIIPSDDTLLKRGEFVSAYRKFLEDHRSVELKTVKEDAWTHTYHLFKLPEAHYAIYKFIDPYRRGYFITCDLPQMSLDDMKEAALADLAQLELQATQAKAGAKVKKSKGDVTYQQLTLENDEGMTTQFNVEYIVDYLKRNLEVWDSATKQPIIAPDFGDTLRQYANAKRLHEQCCYCGSALKADEWMAVQVAPNIGVQSFSNRLEGGSSREPKRNVCDVCRAQFILEKLAWRGHRDKQNAEQVTFYLHLFPYAYFTRPLLRAWWLSIEKLRDADHSAFFLDTRSYFRTLQRLQTEVRIQGFRTSTNGINLPTLSDTISNTPVLSIVAPGDNYGLQFLLALEKAVVLSLTRNDFETLVNKLSLLYQLSEKLYYVDPKSKDKTDHVPHDFATAAADDPMALYFEADRFIEKKVGTEKSKASGAPELQAIQLSKVVAPILDDLVKL
ncbi:MAG: type I-D CRISPR-associated protein Cas10d/Csc3 [Chloroflexi bacterium]|nr:MAG: type I-D CRISPR-associated protein Cas10d/Csc3 [Chloroflexota bacterium]